MCSSVIGRPATSIPTDSKLGIAGGYLDASRCIANCYTCITLHTTSSSQGG